MIKDTGNILQSFLVMGNPPNLCSDPKFTVLEREWRRDGVKKLSIVTVFEFESKKQVSPDAGMTKRTLAYVPLCHEDFSLFITINRPRT